MGSFCSTGKTMSERRPWAGRPSYEEMGSLGCGEDGVRRGRIGIAKNTSLYIARPVARMDLGFGRLAQQS